MGAVLTDIDPAKYVINFGGANINGYADGVYSSFELDEDFYNTLTGADGFTTRVRTNNNTGILTVTLVQSSPSNSVLQAFFDVDRTSPFGSPLPLIVKNLIGTEFISSSAAWIIKLPTLDQGKEVQNREWRIQAADVKVFAGGNAIFQA